jgi:hypothetical protein
MMRTPAEDDKMTPPPSFAPRGFFLRMLAPRGRKRFFHSIIVFTKQKKIVLKRETPHREDFMRWIKIFLMLLLVWGAWNSWAANEFYFAPVKFYGKGCPEGHTQVVMTPDQKSVSILFDSFGVEVPQFDGDNDNQNFWVNRQQIMARDQRYDYLTCNIVIDAFIPAGEKIEGVSIDVDWRGAAHLEKGTEASLTASLVQWLGLRSRSAKVETLVRKNWAGNEDSLDEDWLAQASRMIPLPNLCAGVKDRQISFKLASILMARILPHMPASQTAAMLNLDSTDVVGKLKLKIKTSPCK